MRSSLLALRFSSACFRGCDCRGTISTPDDATSGPHSLGETVTDNINRSAHALATRYRLVVSAALGHERGSQGIISSLSLTIGSEISSSDSDVQFISLPE